MRTKSGHSISRKLGVICQNAAKISKARLALLYAVDEERAELHWLQGLASAGIPRDHLRIIRRLHIPINASGGLYARAIEMGKTLQAAPGELQSTYGDLIQRWIPVAAMTMLPIKDSSGQTKFLLVLGHGQKSAADRNPTAAQIEKSLSESISNWQSFLSKVHQSWIKRQHKPGVASIPRLPQALVLSLSIKGLHSLAPQIEPAQWNRLIHNVEYIYEVFLMSDAYHTLHRGPAQLLIYALKDQLAIEKGLEQAIGLKAHLNEVLHNFLTGLASTQTQKLSATKLEIHMALSLGAVQRLRLGSRRQIWGPAVEGAEMLRRSARADQILCTLGNYSTSSGAFKLLPRGQARLPGESEASPLYELQPPS